MDEEWNFDDEDIVKTLKRESEIVLIENFKENPTKYTNNGCLYLGNFESTEDLELLKNYGIQSILNTSDLQISENTKKYLNTSVENTELTTYLQLNLIDDVEQEIVNLLDMTNNWLMTRLNDGRNILVNCNKGERRSVAIVIAFLIRNGNSYSKSIEIVDIAKTKHNLPMRFDNPSFVYQLQEWERMNKKIDSSYQPFKLKKNKGKKPSVFEIFGIDRNL